MFRCRCGRRSDRGEVDGLTAVDPALAAREHEQRLDQAFLLLADGKQLLARVPVGLDAGVRIAQRELEQGALERERRAQLVRRVGDELPLRIEGRLEAAEQSIDRLTKLPSSSSGPVRSSRRWRLLAEISLAVSVIVRSGRSARPAITQPSQNEITAITASANAESMNSLCTAASDCPWAAVAASFVLVTSVFGPTGDDELLRRGADAERTPAVVRLGDQRRSAGADEERARVLVVDKHVCDREQRGRRAEEQPAVDERRAEA